MSLRTRRHDVALAQAKLQHERALWITRTQSLRARVHAHRARWIIGSGFAGGLLAGFLPLRGLGRAGGVVSHALGFVLRSPLVALLFAEVAKKPPAAKPDSNS